MNTQQTAAQAKASWGIPLQPHRSVVKPTQNRIGLEFMAPSDWPREKATVHERMDLALSRIPALRHLSVLPAGSLMILVSIPHRVTTKQAH